MGNDDSTTLGGFNCADAVGRATKGTVIFRDGAVHVSFPSPGTAVFEPEDVDQLVELGMAANEGVDALRGVLESRRRQSFGDEQRGRSS